MTALTYPISAALALQEVRSILNHPTTNFYSDEEINNWVIAGAADTALKGLGVIKQDTITLATGTLTYTAMTTGGADSVKKIVRVIGANYDTSYLGLSRINPLAMLRYPNKTAGPSEYYFHMNTVFGVYPLPTAAENAKLITVWYSSTAEAITDLPNYHQHFAIYYALSMAYEKAKEYATAEKWIDRYAKGIAAARELYDPMPDTEDMLTMAKTRPQQ